MKVHQEISPWKVTERTQTKQFHEENHFSLPKMSLQLRRQSMVEQQNIINSQLASSIELGRSNSRLSLTKSNSLGGQWMSRKLNDRRDKINNVYQNSGFRPSPPLISHKKTYKYHEIIDSSHGLYPKQSTPVIKQRMQMLLKNYDLPELNRNYLHSINNQRASKVMIQKREAARTNIQFIYRSDVKAKKGGQSSPRKQIKLHILDNLLSQWES